MNRIQELYQSLKPYIAKDFNSGTISVTTSSSGGGGSGGLTAHGLSSAFHTGTLADAQAPQFLKRDGTRSVTGNLSVDAGITIDGIDVGTPGAGLGISGSQLVVNQAYGFVWTAEHQFSAGLKATHVGATAGLLVDPTTDLTLTPGNKVYLTAGKEIRTTDWVSGFLGAGWGITNPSGASLLDIRKIQVEELHAYVFIADIERVRVGETFVTQSMGILKTDMTTPAVGSTTTLRIEDIPQAAGAAFLNNEWVLMQLVDRSGGGITIARAWGQVSTYVDGTGANEGTQSYTYTHRSGTVGLTFKEGSYVLSFGLSGDGYIHESVIDAAGSPYTRYATWVTDPSVPANRTVHVQIGNLDSVTDVDLSPSGWGLYADNVFLNGDFLTGNGDIRIYQASGINIQEDVIGSYVNQRALQWWPDVTIISGTPSLTLFTGKDVSSSQNISFLNAHPTGGVSASLEFQAVHQGSGTDAQIIMDGGSSATPRDSLIQLFADSTTIWGPLATNLITTDGLLPSNVNTPNDIGTSGNRFDTIYADNIIANTLTAAVTSGATLSGNIWQNDASNMTIESDSASNRILFVTNPGAGTMSLNVDNDIVVGGNVDGVDISAFYTAYGTHSHVHSTLSGLTSGDPHTQYVSLSIARTITAQHTFTPGSAQAPFVLGANAQSQLVTGLRADQVNRQVIAGSGLSGTGTLTNDVTLAIAWGTPTIGTITPDAAASAGSAVTAARSDHVHAIVADAPSVNLSISATNAEGSSTSFARADHAHAITASSNPGAAAALLASTAAGALTLQSLTLAGTGLVLSSVNGTLSMADNTNTTHKLGKMAMGYVGYATWAGIAHRDMASAGNFALMQDSGGATILNAATGATILHRINNADVMDMAPDRLLPASTILIDLGDYNRKWRTLYAAELYVETLVAQSVMATIGGRIMVAPTTKLIANMNTLQTTIDVLHNNIQSGHYLFLQSAPGGVAQIEAMKATSGATTITGGYRYTVTRNLDGTGANTWETGDAVVDLGGSVGQGYIDLTSTSTIHNHLGPTISIYSRTATTSWNSVAPVVSMGNLRSFVDYSADTFGWAVGNDLTLTPSGGFNGLTGDATNGLRLFNVVQKFFNSGVEALRVSKDSGISFANIGSAIVEYKAVAWYRNGVANLASSDAVAFVAAHDSSGANTLNISAAQGPTGSAEIVLYGINNSGSSTALQIRGARPAYSMESQTVLSSKYIAFETHGGASGVLISPTSVSIGSPVIAGGWLTTFTPPNNSIHFTQAYGTLASSSSSEISNDLSTFKQLMILGNTSNGGLRQVGMWDQVQIGGPGFFEALSVAGGIFMSNLATPGTPVAGGTLYVNAGKLTYKSSLGTTSPLAELANAQTFTTTQTFQPTVTTDQGLSVKMPTSTTGDALEIYYNNLFRGGFRARSNVAICYVYHCDLGASVAGPNVFVGRNSNATTPSAGTIGLSDRSGALVYYWTDATGILRASGTAPTSAASDTGGAVVGAQTSMAEAKNISDVLPDPLESLRNILEAAKQLRAFRYKSGAYNGEAFPCGVVTDLSPRYGMDRSVDVPHGKSLNVAVAIGDLIASVTLIAKHLGMEK